MANVFEIAVKKAEELKPKSTSTVSQPKSSIDTPTTVNKDNSGKSTIYGDVSGASGGGGTSTISKKNVPEEFKKVEDPFELKTKSRVISLSPEESAKVGTLNREGIYGELTESGTIRRVVSDTGESIPQTFSSKTVPRFTNGKTVIVEGINVPEGVVRNVEKAEPYPVYTFATGESLVERRKIQTEPSIKTIEEERKRVQENLRIQAIKELTSRREAQARRYEQFGDKISAERIRSAPLENFGDLTGVSTFPLAYSKEGSKILEENPQLALKLGRIERESYYTSKELTAKRLDSTTGKLYGFTSDVEAIPLVLELFGRTGRRQEQQELVRKELMSLGLSSKEAQVVTPKILSGSKARQVIVGSAQVVPEIASESIGLQQLSPRLGTITSIPIKKAPTVILKKTIPTYMGLGATEGASSVLITDLPTSKSGKQIAMDVGLGTAIGGFSAPIFGAIPIALEVRGGTSKLGGKTLRGFGSILDAPVEQLGDVSYDLRLAQKGRSKILQRVDLDKAGVKTVTFTPSGKVSSPIDIPVTSNVPTPTQNILLNVNKDVPVFGSPIPSVVKTPSPIGVRAVDFTPSTPVDIPVESNIDVPVSTNSITTTAVPSVVPNPFLPVLPPALPSFGAESKGRSGAERKRFLNELDVGLAIFGGLNKGEDLRKNIKQSVKYKPVSSKKKSKDTKIVNVNLDFGLGQAFRVKS